MPLTDAAIRAAKPAEKPRKLYDGESLYLEVAPSGGKWWRLKYRWAGRKKRLILGTYPEVTLLEARRRRDDAKRTLAEGADPSAERQSQKMAANAAAGSTFETVARAWHVSWKRMRAQKHADQGGCAEFCVNGQSTVGASRLVRLHKILHTLGQCRRPDAAPVPRQALHAAGQGARDHGLQLRR